MTSERFDVAVIGAGPAGMCAAIEAASVGLSVVVLDEQPAPGGQIYRAIEAASSRRKAVLGVDYTNGKPLVDEFRASGAKYIDGASVINVGTDHLIDFRRNGRVQFLRAANVVVAAGAFERPCPVPGWTLPGVTTAGAIQILLKGSGIVPENVVLAGGGPLLWLVAAQLVTAGAPPAAIVETVPRMQMLAAIRHLPRALQAKSYLLKGRTLIAQVRAADVPVYRHATRLCVEGNTAAEAFSFEVGRRRHRIETQSVALHQGVIPNQQIGRLLLCEHVWDRSQHCFRPVLDQNCQTTMNGIYIAGDAAGISGASAAALQGRIVGLHLAATLARRPDATRMGQARADLAREQMVRPFLETLYAPAREILRPEDSTVVCRCEEISAGDIRARVALGVPGSNQLKSMTRTGMGPCQGRVCGVAVSSIIAHARGERPECGDYYRIRPPLKPLPLIELAAYPEERSQEVPTP